MMYNGLELQVVRVFSSLEPKAHKAVEDTPPFGVKCTC